MYEKLVDLAERLEQVRDQISTEEATKTSLILPFIRELGYDIFNPAEVIPEFTADVGIKKGEKVDYAVCVDGSPAILFECKPLGAKLDSYSSQLYRYFSVTSARIAVLTDGVEYRFYSDLKQPNKLDDRPFYTLHLDHIRPDDGERIEQFAKAKFNLVSILEEAESLQLRLAIRSHFAREIKEPSEAFVRHFADPLHNGRMMQAVVDKYRVLVRAAISDYVSDSVERRLQSALQSNRDAGVTHVASEVDSSQAEQSSDADGEGQVVTTMEELHGFYAVKAILAGEVEPKRITARDVRSYFGVLLDDNNRKPICRLRFNRSQKYLGVFDEKKSETKIPIVSVDELFVHAEKIRASLRHALD